MTLATESTCSVAYSNLRRALPGWLVPDAPLTWELSTRVAGHDHDRRGRAIDVLLSRSARVGSGGSTAASASATATLAALSHTSGHHRWLSSTSSPLASGAAPRPAPFGHIPSGGVWPLRVALRRRHDARGRPTMARQPSSSPYHAARACDELFAHSLTACSRLR